MTQEAQPIFLYARDLTKRDLAEKIRTDLEATKFRLNEVDFDRPWGGFLRVDSQQAPEFIKRFFPDIQLPDSALNATLDPKLLIVDSGKRLSWQVHEKRGEFWRVIQGPVGVYLSETDEEPKEPNLYINDEIIDIPVGTRHRLAGLGERGIVAEIWINMDKDNPSDEEDIRRISDDFGRQS